MFRKNTVPVVTSEVLKRHKYVGRLRFMKAASIQLSCDR